MTRWSWIKAGNDESVVGDLSCFIQVNFPHGHGIFAGDDVKQRVTACRWADVLCEVERVKNDLEFFVGVQAVHSRTIQVATQNDLISGSRPDD